MISFFRHLNRSRSSWDNTTLLLARLAIVLSVLLVAVTTQGSCYARTWETLLDEADSLFQVQQMDSAITLCNVALEMARSEFGEQDTVVAKLLYSTAIMKYRMGKYSEAESMLKQALVIDENEYGPDHAKVANVLNALASVVLFRGRHDEAEQLYHRVLEIRRDSLGEKSLQVAKVMANIGFLYNRQGRLIEAELLFEQALPIFMDSLGENHQSTAQARNLLAILYMDQGKTAKAKQLFEQILEYLEGTLGPDNLDVASVLQNLAILANRQKRYDDAEALYLRSATIKEQQLGPEHPSVAESLNSLSMLYGRMDRLEEALQYSERVQTIWDAVYGPGHPTSASSMFGTAKLYQRLGRYEEAESLYVHALGIWELVFSGEHNLMATGLESYSNLLRETGNVESAAEKAEQAFAIRRRNFVDNYAILSEQDALNYANLQQNSASNFLTCFFEAGTADPDIIRTAANIVLSTKGLVTDGILERRHSRVTSRDTLTVSLIDSLRRVRSRISELFVGSSSEETEKLQAEADSLLDLADELETRLSRRSLHFRQMREFGDVDVELVAQRLPEKSILLEYLKYDYFPLDADTVIPRYLVTVIDADGSVILLDLGDASAIDPVIDEYRRHMLEASAKRHLPLERDKLNYATIVGRLYDMVLCPIQDYLRHKDLVLLAPDGGLNLLSFSGLIDGDGSYLVELYPLHYLSSGRELAKLESAPANGSGLLAIGDPDYDASPVMRKNPQPEEEVTFDEQLFVAAPALRSGLEYFTGGTLSALPGTRREVDSIASDWLSASDEAAITLHGTYASEDMFKSEAPGKRIIHLATHGYCISGLSYDSSTVDEGTFAFSLFADNPLLQSGLFFAGANLRGRGADSAGVEDGILTAYEVSSLDLRGTEIVTLSACETAAGRVEQGEGVYGLRRAFRMAGARTIISALWPVSDSETASMMVDIYGGGNESLPQRLQRLQLGKIAELRVRQIADHPYNWAAFITLGDWR